MEKSFTLDIQRDLTELFRGFEWKMKGLIDVDGKVYPIPKIPQVITGIFESIAGLKIRDFVKAKYQCSVIEGNPREYPDITMFGGKLGDTKMALDIKTTRRIGLDRVSGFTIGSFAGYFLNPDKKMAGCRFPYHDYCEHWIIGFIYTWDEDAESSRIVSDIETIVQPKWQIASKSTGTGTTFAISSVRSIKRLREAKGDFSSSEEFEEFWRNRGFARISRINRNSDDQLKLID